MTDSEKIEHLEKEVEVLKKRVDYFYEKLRPLMLKENCNRKYKIADNAGPINCYEKYDCKNCFYTREGDDDTLRKI